MKPYTLTQPGRQVDVLFRFFAVYAGVNGTVEIGFIEQGTDHPGASGPTLRAAFDALIHQPAWGRPPLRESGYDILVETPDMAVTLKNLGIDEGRITIEPQLGDYL